MLKATAKIVLLLLSAILILYFAIDIFAYFFQPMYMSAPMPAPPPPMMGMEAGPIKINISEETPWLSIVKLLTTVLGTYLGIKVINKYVK